MVKLLPMGERAVLAEVGDLDAVLILHAALEAARPAGVVDIVPAARTVLVRVDPRRLPLHRARSWIAQTAEATDAAPPPRADGSAVEVNVVYDGPDLAVTAELLDMSTDELVRTHLRAQWTVAFTGFAPGFAYLISSDWDFDVPRLDAPRTRVPAGSVGLAGAFSGAYPRETPGGWRLIGTTEAVLFDPDAASPALLAPGARVRFRETPAAAPPAAAPPAAAPPAAKQQLRAETAGADRGLRASVQSRGVEAGDVVARVIEPGLLATVQDLGRPGHAALGVAVSGALDRGALRTANRLVGNAEDAAGVEVTMGGLRAVAARDAWFAVAGAWGAIRLDDRDVDPYEAHAWPAGAQVHLDWFEHGARAYLAVRGGLGGRRALGSRATDRMAGLGPAPLRAGDVITTCDETAGPVPVPGVAPWGAPHDEDFEVEVAPGPRGGWFAASARSALFESVWTVTNAADRVGLRLDGPRLERIRHDELPSEGMVPGALQVPPSGRPTILLADGPVTGGYPVIAVATDAALDAIAQARPGSRIRFRHARPL